MNVQSTHPAAWCVDSLGHVDALILSDYAGGTFHAHSLVQTQELIARAGCPVIVDCKPSAYMDVFAGATLVAPNHREALAMGRRLGMNAHEPALLARALRAWFGAEGVAVTLGPEGVVYAGADRACAYPARPCTNPQVIGAGDAFLVGAVPGLVAGLPGSKVVEQANRYAGVYITRPRTGYHL